MTVSETASIDEEGTAFGARAEWSPQFATIADMVRASDVPMTLYWGPDHRLFYNAAALPGFAGRSAAIGAAGADVWGDWWPPILEQLRHVEHSRRSLTMIDTPFAQTEGDRVREIYWNLTFWPVIGADGGVAGILCAGRDVTDEVFRKRHNRLIVELDDALAKAGSIDAVTHAALQLIGRELNAPRVVFAEASGEPGTFDVRHEWSGSDMPDVRGHYTANAFGEIGTALRRGETVLIDDAHTDPRTLLPHIVDRYRSTGFRAGILVPILDGERYEGAIVVQDNSARAWTPFEIGLAESATRRLWAALTRRRAQAALRASEQRYRLIFEQAEDIIFTADIDQTITDTNAAGARAMGMAREEIIGRSIADFVSPEGFAQTTAMLRQKLEHGGNTRHEVTVMGRDGRRMRWDNNSTLIFDRDDTPIGLLSISRDVTERRAFEERRELLINELNHRVKNTLALVQAIAAQTFPKGGPGASQRDEFLARLQTLAGAHDLLTREDWSGVTLADVVRWGTAAIGGCEDRIAAGGPALTLTPKAGLALAMALHELATNAIKYGALSTPDGRVDLIWRQRGDRIGLDWRERGGPPVTPPTRRGFGSRMIERVLASDLAGRVAMDFAPTGLHCAIDAPVEGNLA